MADVNLLDHVPETAKLRQVGRDRWRGRCPILDHAQGAFEVRKSPRGHLRFVCYACNVGGTVIDLVMKLDGCTLSEAVKRLSKGTARLSPEDRLARMADAWRAQRPAYGVLICDACRAVKALASLEDTVYGRWWMSPDGAIALCPSHATRRAYRTVLERRAPGKAAA